MTACGISAPSFPRLLRPARPRDRGVRPAGAAQRSDADVRQCGHGAVQERVHRRLRPAPTPRRDSQKCVRAGGKHNDLDNVGYTARHHTFFEMLGNFSFGDYFKEQAIELAWNLVTREYGLDARKAAGDGLSHGRPGLRSVEEDRRVSDDKIIRIPTSDNFWAMGDTGPCGPCSEIFYDHGDHIPGGPPGSPDEDGDRFIEIWNLVFMQFEQVTRMNASNCPSRPSTPAWGWSAFRAVLQGTHDNYETILFRALISASEDQTGVEATGQRQGVQPCDRGSPALHQFLIADGVLPSNEGRGYVLRRIMRRAMRHATCWARRSR
jgi:alanyl-tRNA synthetase